LQAYLAAAAPRDAVVKVESTQSASERTAIDNGINFMDNLWDHSGGQSEIRMGKALRDGYRQQVFLMTKLDGQDARTATMQLDESLKRLQVDQVDLIQFHEVIRMDDPGKIFAPGGALEGMIKARRAGKVRYIGFTGHKSPEIHLHMLDIAFKNNFIFDTAAVRARHCGAAGLSDGGVPQGREAALDADRLRSTLVARAVLQPSGLDTTCARTTSSSIPYLHAVHRMIMSVEPVYWPSTRL
jgi:predicted oxidoreductase